MQMKLPLLLKLLRVTFFFYYFLSFILFFFRWRLLDLGWFSISLSRVCGLPSGCNRLFPFHFVFTFCLCLSAKKNYYFPFLLGLRSHTLIDH